VAITTIRTDASYLDESIAEVEKVLTKKRQDWATGMEVFECFDAQNDFGDDPLDFAIKMRNLKMTRLKSCVSRRHAETNSGNLGADLEDTLKDLAGYALLALGLYKREAERNPKMSHTHGCGCIPTIDDPLLQFCRHAKAEQQQIKESLQRDE
jgi:hypothetical protein